VRGASGVEGIFVFLLVEFVGIQVNRECSFFLKAFQSTALYFEMAELVSVQDKLGFFGGDEVKTGGQCMIIVIDQDSGGGSRNRGRGRDDGSQGG